MQNDLGGGMQIRQCARAAEVIDMQVRKHDVVQLLYREMLERVLNGGDGRTGSGVHQHRLGPVDDVYHRRVADEIYRQLKAVYVICNF